MKFAAVLVALLGPLSASAFTVSDPTIVRVLDGNAYNCKETYEGGKTAFVPTIAKLGADGSLVSLSVNVAFELCVRNGTDLHWTARSPLDPIYGHDTDGGEVRTEFRNPELVLGDSLFSRLQVAPLSNDATEKVDYQFAPSDFLTGSDLADLNAGKPVRVRLELLYRAIGTAFTSRGETPLGYQFGGTYTVLFTLQK